MLGRCLHAGEMTPRLRRRVRRILAGMALVALVLRLLFGVLWAKPVSYMLNGDAVSYQAMAVNLCLGRGISETSPEISPAQPSSSRVPLYPIFQASIYCVFGVNHVLLRIAQAILGTIACLLIYRLGVLAWNWQVGLTAAGFAAIYQPFIHYYYYGGPGSLFPEYFLSFVLVCFGLAFLAALRSHRAWWWPASGALLGLAALTRPEVAPFLIFALLLIVWHEAPRYKAALLHGGLVAAAMLVVLSPWMVRNYYVHGRFVALATMGGRNFYLGNNAGGRGHIGEDLTPADELRLGALPEAQRDREYYRLGVEFWRRHPGSLPKLFAKKLLTLMAVYNEDVRVLFNAFYSFMLPFALLGVLLALRRGRANTLPLLFVALLVHYLVIAMLFFGEPRYRYGIEAFLILLAAYAGWVVAERLPRRVVATGIGLWVVVNALGYLYWEDLFPALRGVAKAIGLG